MDQFSLPPGERWQRYELQGLALRDFAGVRANASLNPFSLAGFASLLVVDFGQIKGLSEQAKDHLLGDAAEDWSGGACSRALPDGRKIIILNPTHGPQRQHATLMEEICHVFLGHTPNRLAVIGSKGGRAVARDYHRSDEEDAYGTGAAALVPFKALREFVLTGKRVEEIARHFRVSRDLVGYRLKVTRLWNLYKTAHGEAKPKH
ncbi:MAG TPA: ImmA/IrrE family metallo-endopeptidase [Pyrinomonadaceae bacterium]|nr:ImmA/IrrE family metallo-endopeptidase [Pyrinomonadaceae bacterium]